MPLKKKQQKRDKIYKGGNNGNSNAPLQSPRNAPLPFSSKEITFIKDIKKLSSNNFPKFIYEGGFGFRTLTVTIDPKSNNNSISKTQNGGLFGFGSSNNKSKKNNLKIDESIYIEGGAMNYMTDGITLVSVAKNGIFSSLYRGFSGSSFFLSSIVNEGTVPGIISLASPNPGDIGCFYIPPGKSFNVVSSSYIASTNNLKISTNAKLGGFITGYGIFYTSIESLDGNPGLVWISSFGELTEYIIKPGNKIKIDNGVLLAFDSTITFSTGLAGKGLLSSVFSNEGFISVIENNGNSDMSIFLQGRSIKSYNDYISDIAYTTYKRMNPSVQFPVSFS